MEINKVSEVKLIYKNRVKASERIRIQNSQDAFDVFWSTWEEETVEHIEEMKMLLLNRSNDVLGVVSISRSGTSGTVIDTRLILQYALKANAHCIILAHNHPSGYNAVIKPYHQTRLNTTTLLCC
jgi:DNA repair protein RadC